MRRSDPQRSSTRQDGDKAAWSIRIYDDDGSTLAQVFGRWESEVVWFADHALKAWQVTV